MAKLYKPGSGWRVLSAPAIYQHTSGVKLHLVGMAVMPDGAIHLAAGFGNPHESQVYIRIAGGNRKRGLMLWARALMERYSADGGAAKATAACGIK